MLGGWISQQFPPPPPSPVLAPSLKEKEKESNYYLVLHKNLKSTARRRWRRVTKTPHSLNKIASFQGDTIPEINKPPQKNLPQASGGGLH